MLPPRAPSLHIQPRPPEATTLVPRSPRLAIALSLAALLACGEPGGAQDPPAPGAVDLAEAASSLRDDEASIGAAPAGGELVEDGGEPSSNAGFETIWLDGLLNGGFELIADGTTTPPKYGAYWVGAFVPVEGDPTDRVTDEVAFRGERSLVLHPGDAVLQKVVADPRLSDRTEVSLAVALLGDARLVIQLEDGTGRRTTAVVAADMADGGELRAGWRTPEGAVLGGNEGTWASGNGESSRGEVRWAKVRVDVGTRFVVEHGSPPTPRLNVHVRCEGGPDAVAYVDEVLAAVHLPRVTAAEMEDRIERLVREQLDLWHVPRDEGGLGLVEPATGYTLYNAIDVNTGEPSQPERLLRLHTAHTLLVDWLAVAHERGWSDEIARWTPRLETFTRSLLRFNFHERGLPQVVRRNGLVPLVDESVDVAQYVGFLLDAAELVADQVLRRRCIEQSRKAATALVWLQRTHDLGPEKPNDKCLLDPATGIFEGEAPNWFGHMPPKLTPTGKLDTPRRYNTAWAIVKQRTFWYHVFQSAVIVARVHELMPEEADVAAIDRVLSLYHRDWDAARYDLENDTDDHYGYLAKDLTELLRVSSDPHPRARELVEEATDHRLSLEGTVDDTLWIQAIRLGTACAGDSPRAFKGVLDLMALPRNIHEPLHDMQLRRAAILELAGNDFKGRQLTNAQFTESFFKNWEMVCICFKGTYQGDCRDHPADYWHGDVGDTFGGPPTTGLEAQGHAYAVAPIGLRPEILARMALMWDVTEADFRRPFGYLRGLDPDVAQQYELPEKYVMGLVEDEPVGLGYAMSWLRVLAVLEPETDTAPVRVVQTGQRRSGMAAAIDYELHGPPDGIVRVYTTGSAIPVRAGPGDARLVRGDEWELYRDHATLRPPQSLGPTGQVERGFSIDHATRGIREWVQVLLLDPQGGPPLGVSPPTLVVADPR